MEKGPCNVNRVNGSCNLMISCHLCVEMERELCQRGKACVNGGKMAA